MTTSHRPQLEARSGAKAAAYTPTGIEHARLLPGHTTLKYRKFKEEENLKANCAQEDRNNDKSLEEVVVNEEKQDVVGSGNLQETRSEKDQKTRCKSCWLLKKIKWKIKQSLKEMNN
ncbi:ANM_collapsed_G0010340.mRNA.1.CDS.1 [Saccharomyces cerevisiae]|nr:ANM_collapsed_G0010340.mRNA.1.CDS.1 [Saccharomyces cerevisiae]